ncbi:MAG: right-handed parallel beta-helix repeat-containing protein, partial [Clostridia bacterium]|nr:right-handed parallel beta-helix repeat-containing protein [Clostridia bacterium]
MEKIYAADYNIHPGHDVTTELSSLLNDLRKTEKQKTVIFEKGTYFIDSEKCEKHMLVITNTAGEKEFNPGETPHLNAVALYFEGISNLVFDGNDSVFVIDGKVTNIALENCRNIELRNFEIRHVHPDMHELRVLRKSPFSVDFEIDSESYYEVKDKKLAFVGKDYKVVTDRKATLAGWIGLIRTETPEKIERVLHPLASSFSVADLGENRIRVKYPATFRFKEGDRFYIYDVRRQYAGIFVNKCRDVSLENISQRFNYSLALVAQDTENIDAEGLVFAPESGSARKMASVADFVQLCMCRGKVSVRNSVFDGAGDDCLNVHGVHFKIVGKKDDCITVRFMHSQTYGFNPLRSGDTIAFVDPRTLLEKETAEIKKSEMIDEYNIKLTLDSADGAVVGDVIEDISACPELDFENNILKKIITRGLLITTRGKVKIRNNRFVSTSMSSILLSDDAKSWFESGMCRNVTIENNIIDYCGQTPILIKPENAVYEGAVHKNIKIIDNEFKDYSGFCVSAESTDEILMKGNKLT